MDVGLVGPDAFKSGEEYQGKYDVSLLERVIKYGEDD